jgi:3-isopropylmalate/(R)-2-methylmalate dehydratase small subunit
MGQSIESVSGAMACLPRADINTDAIIPSTWLRTATADLGKGLFGGERYNETGVENPDFILNQSSFRHSKLLLANQNFGCGSSREAAVWALIQFGIKCVLAPSFADIFYENAFRNKLIAGIIDDRVYEQLKNYLETNPDGVIFTADLRSMTLSADNGPSWSFSMPASRVHALIKGDDEITTTLRYEKEILAFHEKIKEQQSWLFPAELVGV